VIAASQPERPRSGFYFKESDAELLRRLVEYRFLQPEDFQRLTGRNLISLRRRLLQLLRHGYIERFTLPLERDAPIGSPPDAYVYQLKPRGVLKAKEYGFADDDYRYTREKSNLFLQHDLLLTKIHLTLELATRSAPIEIVGWEQRRAVLLDWADHESGRLSVNPDALFGLKDKEKPEGQNTTYCFLEVVRSRESDYQAQQSYFMRKMHAFMAYHRQGKHVARYGISNFRVITVTPTKQRALNLCEKLRNAGLTSKRFWFTDLAAVCNEDRAEILEKVFFTPQDYQDGALYGFRE
jgi:protein involved in plasmid replication-relaxation